MTPPPAAERRRLRPGRRVAAWVALTALAVAVAAAAPWAGPAVAQDKPPPDHEHEEGPQDPEDHEHGQEPQDEGPDDGDLAELLRSAADVAPNVRLLETDATFLEDWILPLRHMEREERWTQYARRLQALLERDAEAAMPLERPALPGSPDTGPRHSARIRVPVSDYVVRKHATLPAAAIETYRAYYDGAALAALDDAAELAARGDDDGAVRVLEQAASRYALTTHGPALLHRLAEVRLRRGLAGAAADAFRRMRTLPDADPDTVTRAARGEAAALAAAGDREGLRALGDVLRDAGHDALAAEVDVARERVATDPTDGASGSFRGFGTHVFSLPLPAPAGGIAEGTPAEEAMTLVRRAGAPEPSPAGADAPTAVPAPPVRLAARPGRDDAGWAVAGVRTAWVVDARGRRVHGMPADDTDAMGGAGPRSTDFWTRFGQHPTVAGDRIVWLRTVPAPGRPQNLWGWNNSGGYSADRTPASELVCTSRDDEALLWRFPAMTGLSPERALPAGPATIAGDRVYLHAITRGGTDGGGVVRSLLVCLDLRSGKLLWHRKLTTMVKDGETGWRRQAESLAVRPAAPLVAAGEVYAMPGLGAVVAVSADTGELRWAVKYAPAEGRSFDAPALVRSGEVLLAAPADGDRILAISTRRRPGDVLHITPDRNDPDLQPVRLLGVDRGRAVLLARPSRPYDPRGSWLALVDVETGSAVGRRPLMTTPAAPPTLAADGVLLPTEEGLLSVPLPAPEEQAVRAWSRVRFTVGEDATLTPWPRIPDPAADELPHWAPRTRMLPGRVEVLGGLVTWTTAEAMHVFKTED